MKVKKISSIRETYFFQKIRDNSIKLYLDDNDDIGESCYSISFEEIYRFAYKENNNIFYVVEAILDWEEDVWYSFSYESDRKITMDELDNYLDCEMVKLIKKECE
jgi:hypothetical protein